MSPDTLVPGKSRSPPAKEALVILKERWVSSPVVGFDEGTMWSQFLG